MFDLELPKYRCQYGHKSSPMADDEFIAVPTCPLGDVMRLFQLRGWPLTELAAKKCLPTFAATTPFASAHFLATSGHFPEQRV